MLKRKNMQEHTIVFTETSKKDGFISSNMLHSLDKKHIKTELGFEIELQGSDRKVGYARLPAFITRTTVSGYLFCILKRDGKTGKRYIAFSNQSEIAYDDLTYYEIY